MRIEEGKQQIVNHFKPTPYYKEIFLNVIFMVKLCNYYVMYLTLAYIRLRMQYFFAATDEFKLDSIQYAFLRG